MEWRNLYRGLLMGTSDLVPGISGGTIAVVLGIYSRLIKAVDGVFSREWKKHVGFFVPLIVGIGVAILTLSKLIHWLLDVHQQPTLYFFLGLIIGVIPFLFKQAEYKQHFRKKHYGFMIMSAILISLLMFVNKGTPEPWGASLTTGQFVLLFFSGWLASMAMILPGISGSFMLLLAGVYPTVIQALSEFQLVRIVIIGLGVLVGLMISSKIINHLFTHYPSYTYAIVIGLVIGSVGVLFPGVPVSVLLSLITFIGGLIIAYLLGKIEY
ncbi:DUF368 domain-containing protein [Pontibacillus yanchengensis]|uniref:DUF368 domain-containing protein n=2 Tax=Pontibacillus yanchengensis TaxID=462910 RepID=A0ACC7VM92_9BACI|nr:DUF368 domain-containing protein [Pontibacillus yanchengensis]MYL35019.1 DUF368 domain-containing protein [Pontibacillus yanchengensis]MYL55269.1 DUF368 domain-containing protein [Pontibacillus yanchengensis]